MARENSRAVRYVGAVAGVIILFAAGVALFGDFAWVPAATGTVDQEATNGTVQAIAEPLFTDWVLAFEATALLLTIAAAVGIVAAARPEPRHAHP